MKIFQHFFNKDIFFKFVQSSELTIFNIALIIFLVFGNIKSLFLSLIILLSSNINYFLKHQIYQPIFKYFNDYIPMFGRGTRPEGASNCGFFDSCPSQVAKSFGFPSGHSQFSGLTYGFLIKDILDSKSIDGKFKSLKLEDKISVIVLFSLILSMMYSRAFIQKCHTIEQTIFGALIGLFIGFKSHDLFKYINHKSNGFLERNKVLLKTIISIFFFYFNLT